MLTGYGRSITYFGSSTLKSLASADFRLLVRLLAADVAGALQLADELRPCKLSEFSFELAPLQSLSWSS